MALVLAPALVPILTRDKPLGLTLSLAKQAKGDPTLTTGPASKARARDRTAPALWPETTVRSRLCPATQPCSLASLQATSPEAGALQCQTPHPISQALEPLPVQSLRRWVVHVPSAELNLLKVLAKLPLCTSCQSHLRIGTWNAHAAPMHRQLEHPCKHPGDTLAALGLDGVSGVSGVRGVEGSAA